MASRLRAARRLEEGRPELIRPRLPRTPSLDDVDEAAWFDADFFGTPAVELARALLGACLVSTVGDGRCVGLIVETEAYGGAEDPASHAATRSGITRRNRAMFGPPGRAYIYRSYGVHWCMNVVSGTEGSGEAVLLRGAAPLAGDALMTRRRRGSAELASGPGRLAQAFAITGDLYGHDLTLPPLFLVPGWAVPDSLVGRSGRIGIRAAADWPHRFYVRGWPGVSRRDVRNGSLEASGDRPHMSDPA